MRVNAAAQYTPVRRLLLSKDAVKSRVGLFTGVFIVRVILNFLSVILN